MKVTAIIEDKTIEELMAYTNASSITAGLKIALKECIRRQKLKDLSDQVKEKPLKFDYTAEELRNLNRQT